MKLLLTGATGFVGRTLLLDALRTRRYTTIYAPVRSPDKLRAQLVGDGLDDIPEQVRPFRASADDWRLDEVPEVDHVVHTAGILAARRRGDYFATNVEGTLRLLHGLRGTPRVVVLSSQSAAGPCLADQGARSEEQPESPVTWYGESKLEMERRIACELPRLDYLILRPPMVLGPRDQMTLPLFKMARGPVRFKPGLRPKWYSFISVDDLVRAVFAALDRGTEWSRLSRRLFFVAADSPVSDHDLIGDAARAIGRRGVLLRVPQPLLRAVSQVVDRVPAWRAAVPNLSVDRAREIWPDRWVVSSRAFQQSFDWCPRGDLRGTLQATHDWYVRTGQLST